jgi:hypothetical protein
VVFVHENGRIISIRVIAHPLAIRIIPLLSESES